jgi:hypothetical protein
VSRCFGCAGEINKLMGDLIKRSEAIPMTTKSSFFAPEPDRVQVSVETYVFVS